jgi:host factor-I protein
MPDNRWDGHDAFLDLLRDRGIDMMMFLVNGIRLEGRITKSDKYTVVLARGGTSQVVYKHAISTIKPAPGFVMPDPEAATVPISMPGSRP